MLPHWKHLTFEQRVEIAHGLAHGGSLESIAERIGLDPTSVSKEIRRNRTQETDGCPRKYGRSRCGCAKFRYVAKAAQAMADKRLVQSRQGLDCDESEFRLYRAKRGIRLIPWGTRGAPENPEKGQKPQAKSTVFILNNLWLFQMVKMAKSWKPISTTVL